MKKPDKPKILYSWIGVRELQEAMEHHPELKDEIAKYMKLNGIAPQMEAKRSSLRLALEAEPYDVVVLMIDYRNQEELDKSKSFLEAYESCLRKDVATEFRVRPVYLKDSKDFEEVYKLCERVLMDYKEQYPAQERHLLLSSGTSVMCACWLFLGKTIFDGSVFLQESGDKKSLRKVNIPFDIYAELRNRQQKLIPVPEISATFKAYIKGNSDAIRKCQEMAEKAAKYDVNVLLLGEPGTGKELFARAIHDASQRKGKWQAVNVGTLQEGTAVSVLFGHVKGAFSGASADKDGLFKAADNGTLFLDEIGECPVGAQAMMLRALQPQKGQSRTLRAFNRLGDVNEMTADVRIIAATNRRIENEKTGFRADLFQRLGTIIIRLPPLRERKDDIPDIAEALLEQSNADFSKNKKLNYKPKKFSSKAVDLMKSYDWPGNVRELENVITRGIIMSKGQIIGPEDLDIPRKEDVSSREKGEDVSLPSAEPVDLNACLKAVERRYIEEAIRLHPHNASKAAAHLGISYQTLKNRMNQKPAPIIHNFRND